MKIPNWRRPLFSSARGDWRTPVALLAVLNEEFHFTSDPCPAGGTDGLKRRWGKRVFLNPPYGRHVSVWLKKAVNELARKTEVVVALLPARTDTRWFHAHVMPHATEIRFIDGRLYFDDGGGRAPFPSMIVVYRR